MPITDIQYDSVAVYGDTTPVTGSPLNLTYDNNVYVILPEVVAEVPGSGVTEIVSIF
jgi:hypothetical protein